MILPWSVRSGSFPQQSSAHRLPFLKTFPLHEKWEKSWEADAFSLLTTSKTILFTKWTDPQGLSTSQFQSIDILFATWTDPKLSRFALTTFFPSLTFPRTSFFLPSSVSLSSYGINFNPMRTVFFIIKLMIQIMFSIILLSFFSCSFMSWNILASFIFWDTLAWLKTSEHVDKCSRQIH